MCVRRIHSTLLLLLFLCFSMSAAGSCGKCETEVCAGGFIHVACTCIRVPGCIIPPNPTPLPIPGTSHSSVQLPPQVQKTVDQLPQQVQQAVKQLGKGAIGEVEHLGSDTLSTVHNAAGDSVKILVKAQGDTITTMQKAGSDVVRTVEKAGKDATATYVKAWRDAGAQARHTFDDTIDAEKAWINFEKNQLRAQRDAVENADKRMREGKVIDAMWGLATDPPKASEKNFAQATQESELINQAAGTAAAIYGGPAGAAAYAAWYTYRRTGDANLAFRAGLQAGVAAEMGSSVAKMPSGTAGEIFKKAAMAGAAGGVAVAAAGGDEKAVKDAFLKSAGTVLIQGGQAKLKAYSPKMVNAYDTVQCISARDVDCLQKTTWMRDAKGKILNDEHGKPRIDPKKLDPNTYIGQWTKEDPNSPQGKAIAFITKVSKLPKSETIPLMKNEWVLTWTIGKNPAIAYKRPTIVLTYVGNDAPFRSSVEYGRHVLASGAANATAASSEFMNAAAVAQAYQCPYQGKDGAVKVLRTSAAGCKAIYERNDGLGHQTIWETDHDSGTCALKAVQFVQHLSRLGIHCTGHP